MNGASGQAAGTLSCGVVIARRDNATWKTLLLRAFHHWDFPKGVREPGEDPLEAAIDDHIYFSKEASSGGRGFGGGGCGCN